MPNESTRPNTSRLTEHSTIVSSDWMLIHRDPGLAARIDGRRELVEVWSHTGRTVLIPRRLFVRFMYSQASKDWSVNVCERLCIAAYRRPKLLGCTEVPHVAA